MEPKKTNQADITRKGNPRKPQGEEGAQMLLRMNDSHGAVTQWALGHLALAPDDHVLDIGCGGGATLACLSARLPAGHLTGGDYSDVSVALSRQTNAADVASGKLEVLEASVEALPFGADTFHKIVTVESFYFWPNPLENLKEVRRVLRPGGVFLLVADIYQKEGLSPETLENIARYQLLNPTPEEFAAMFRQAGFAESRIHTKEGTNWICVEGIK